jgi:ABC-type glutathione transport system ATPase component
MSGAVDGPEQPQSVLKVQSLRRVVTTQQEGGKVILAGISFEVSSGEILFVTGKCCSFDP